MIKSCDQLLAWSENSKSVGQHGKIKGNGISEERKNEKILARNRPAGSTAADRLPAKKRQQPAKAKGDGGPKSGQEAEISGPEGPDLHL